MLPRREARWNLQGCPKLANRSQPLVRRSSPYYEDMWRRYRCLTIFSRLSIHVLAAKIQPDKVERWCRNGDFLRPVFAASRVQHISDMHSKFAGSRILWAVDWYQNRWPWMTLNGIMTLILRYFTEFVYNVVVEELLGPYLGFKMYFR